MWNLWLDGLGFGLVGLNDAAFAWGLSVCFSGLVVGFGGGFIVVLWVGCLGVLLVYLSDFLVGLVLWLCLVVGCFRVVVWDFGFWCF